MRVLEKSERNWLFILAAVAIIFNIITVSPLIPWQNWLLWTKIEPVKDYHITIENYRFVLPDDVLVIKAGEPVKFVITSKDVTYGFGVFAKNGRMLFQMQVLPNWNNTITWIFDEPGKYSIRSTEYSGPEHPHMFLEDAIEVVK